MRARPAQAPAESRFSGVSARGTQKQRQAAFTLPESGSKRSWRPRHPVFPAALLDYNGVLVDDEHVHLAAFNAALARIGLEISEEAYFARYLGYDDRGAFAAILRDRGRVPEPSTIEELVRSKEPEYLARARAELKTFPGAAELLSTLSRTGPIGIVSGALRNEIELGLGVLGARHTVRFIVAAEDAGVSKPDPAGYRLGLLALEREGVAAPHEALVVEDSLAGVEAAKRAGLFCVAVAHSYSERELRSSGADFVVPSLTTLGGSKLEELHAANFG